MNGLPDQHRCPECGWEYDRRPRMWLKTRRLLTVCEILVNLLLALSFGVCFMWGYTLSGLLGAILQIILVFVYVCIFIVRWRSYSTQKRGDFVAVTSEGIHFRLNEMLDPVLIPWRGVVEIRPRRIKKGCTVVIKDAADETEDSEEEVEITHVFATQDDVQAFVEYAQAVSTLTRVTLT